MRALYICGSINQTRMVHQVARQLSQFEAYFTPYYCDGFKKLVCRAGLLDFTVMGGQFLQRTLKYRELVAAAGPRHSVADLINLTRAAAVRLGELEQALHPKNTQVRHFTLHYRRETVVRCILRFVEVPLRVSFCKNHPVLRTWRKSS